MSSMMTTSEKVEVVDDVVEGPEVVDDDVAKRPTAITYDFVEGTCSQSPE